MRALDILPLAGFSLASSSLLVLNKLCLTHCRTPSTLASFQFFFATLLCVVLHLSGRACIDITFARVRSYLLYTAIFSGAIYTNMKSLSNFSVETVIVGAVMLPTAGGCDGANNAWPTAALARATDCAADMRSWLRAC